MAGTVLYWANAEGNTEGTPLTSSLATSGGTGGNKFDVVSTGTGNTITYAAEAALHGGLGYLFTLANANPFSTCTWNSTTITSAITNPSICYEFVYNAAPTSNVSLISGYASTDATTNGTNDLIIREASSTGRFVIIVGTTTVYTAATQPLVDGTAYRLDFEALADAKAKMTISGLESSVAIIDTGVLTLPAALSVRSLRVGVGGSTTGWSKFKADNLRLGVGSGSTAGAGFLPPLAGVTYTAPANAVPTIATITNQNKQVGQTTTVTAVATDTDGTVASNGYNWTVESFPGSTAPVLTNANTATVSVGALPTAGTVVLGVTATDNNGGVSAKRTVSIAVTAAAGSTVAPDKIVSNAGVWAYGGTATSLVDAFSATVSGL